MPRNSILVIDSSNDTCDRITKFWKNLGGFSLADLGLGNLGAPNNLFSPSTLSPPPHHPHAYLVCGHFLKLVWNHDSFSGRSHFNTQLKKLKTYLKFFLAYFDSGLRNNYMFSKSKFGLSPFTSYQNVLDPPLNLSVPSQNKS